MKTNHLLAGVVLLLSGALAGVLVSTTWAQSAQAVPDDVMRVRVTQGRYTIGEFSGDVGKPAVILLDTATGESWRLVQRDRWVALPQTAGEDG